MAGAAPIALAPTAGDELGRELRLDLDDVRRLVDAVDVRVEAYPASGPSPFHDYWVAVLNPLRLEYSDYGLDATLVGLASRVGKRVRDLLDERTEERRRLLPLLVRLLLAEEDGSLGSLLERSTVLVDWDYDEYSSG